MDIIKIDKVNDYSCKSFNQYTGPTSLFGKSNIFFASNGQGKSSFALGIEAEYLKSYDTQIIGFIIRTTSKIIYCLRIDQVLKEWLLILVDGMSILRKR